MKDKDWVDTPRGVGVLGGYSEDKLNAYVWIDKRLHAFALDLVVPLDKAVSEILTAVNTQGE